MNAKSDVVVRRDVLLERVVVEVLRAVGEVGARHARGRAGPARSFWIRIFPFAEPKPPATQSSSASRSTRAWCEAKCQVARDRFCTETYSTFARLPDDDLDRSVRVGGELRRGGRVLLDQREPALRLRDDEEAPEQRAALGRRSRCARRAASRGRRRAARARAGRSSTSRRCAPRTSRPSRRASRGARGPRGAARSGSPRARARSRSRASPTWATPEASSSSSEGRRRDSVAPFAAHASGSNPARSVNRQCSSFVVGSGSAR